MQDSCDSELRFCLPIRIHSLCQLHPHGTDETSSKYHIGAIQSCLNLVRMPVRLFIRSESDSRWPFRLIPLYLAEQSKTGFSVFWSDRVRGGGIQFFSFLPPIMNNFWVTLFSDLIHELHVMLFVDVILQQLVLNKTKPDNSYSGSL